MTVQVVPAPAPADGVKTLLTAADPAVKSKKQTKPKKTDSADGSHYLRVLPPAKTSKSGDNSNRANVLDPVTGDPLHPGFDLGKIRAAIPKECFVKSLRRSLQWMAWDMAVVNILLYLTKVYVGPETNLRNGFLPLRL